MSGDRKLVGTKSILRYLQDRHEITICRETLHRLRTGKLRAFSCSEIAAGASKFPASPVFDGLTVSVVADPDEVDAWIARHRRVVAET